MGPTARCRTGFSPSLTFCSKKLTPRRYPKHPLQITTRAVKQPDFKFELLPLHSPLLRQSLLVSFPPLIDMLKFSGYPYLIRGQPYKNWGVDQAARRLQVRACESSVYRGRDQPAIIFGTGPVTDRESNTKPGLRGDNDARTGMPFGIPKGAMCVQRFDDSRNSAIRITYRISLRSSSMPEPRDPLLKVFIYFLVYSDKHSYTEF